MARGVWRGLSRQGKSNNTDYRTKHGRLMQAAETQDFSRLPKLKLPKAVKAPKMPKTVAYKAPKAPKAPKIVGYKPPRSTGGFKSPKPFKFK